MPAPKKPQDRQAKAEGKNADLSFDFDGTVYTIPRDHADNIELFELIEDGKNILAARAFLGAKQWDQFKDSVRTPDGRVPAEPTERFLNLLMVAIGGGAEKAPNS